MPYVSYYFGPTIGRLTDKAGKRLISMNDTGAGIMNYDPNVDPTNTSTKIGSVLISAEAFYKLAQPIPRIPKPGQVDLTKLLGPIKGPESYAGRVEAKRRMSALRQIAGQEPARPAPPAAPPKVVTPEMSAAAMGLKAVPETTPGAVKMAPKVSLLARLLGRIRGKEMAPAFHTLREPVQPLPSGVTPEEAAKLPKETLLKGFKEELPRHLRHLTEAQKGKLPGFLRTQLQYPLSLLGAGAGAVGRGVRGLVGGVGGRIKERFQAGWEYGRRQPSPAQRFEEMLKDPGIAKAVAAKAGIPYEPPKRVERYGKSRKVLEAGVDLPEVGKVLERAKFEEAAPTEPMKARAERGRIAEEKRKRGQAEIPFVTAKGETVPTKTEEDIQAWRKYQKERKGVEKAEKEEGPTGKKVKALRRGLKKLEEPATPKVLGEAAGPSPAFAEAAAGIRRIPEGALSPEEMSGVIRAIKREQAAGEFGAGAIREAVSKLSPEKQKIVADAFRGAREERVAPRQVISSPAGGMVEVPQAKQEAPFFETYEMGPTRPLRTVDVEHPLLRPWRTQVNQLFEASGTKFDPTNPHHIDLAISQVAIPPNVQRNLQAAGAGIREVAPPKKQVAVAAGGQVGAPQAQQAAQQAARQQAAQDPLMAQHFRVLGIPMGQPSGGLSPEEAAQFRRMMAVQSGQAPVSEYIGAAGQRQLPGWMESVLPYVGMVGAMQLAEALGLGAAGGLPAMMLGPAAAQSIAGRLGYGGGQLAEPAQQAYIAGLTPKQFGAQYRQ